jgi:RNA ligase
MLTYGRECVKQQVWDHITTKCRGIIWNLETYEVVSRPFEKFQNLNTSGIPETNEAAITREPDSIVEKVDGFLCTMYTFEGQEYIASKGSFHSPHAKWATAWYQKHQDHYEWPAGYTPVFEGICPSLRIVVDYGHREELVLLALVNVETGEEVSGANLLPWATANNLHTPATFPIRWKDASLSAINPDVKNFEGYVLVWNRPGTTPFRLKVKYVDYLRLHRMVCGVSPKAIFQAVSKQDGWEVDLDYWMTEGTPWFNKFVSKWKNALETRYDEIANRATEAMQNACRAVRPVQYEFEVVRAFIPRKEWAEEFNKTPELAPVLFAMLDGKDPAQIIWKKVKPMIKSTRPLVDASQ